MNIKRLFCILFEHKVSTVYPYACKQGKLISTAECDVCGENLQVITNYNPYYMTIREFQL